MWTVASFYFEGVMYEVYVGLKVENQLLTLRYTNVNKYYHINI